MRFHPSVAAAEQGVVLGGVLAADAPGPGRQLAQGLEGDAKAFGAHGRGARLEVLIPEMKTHHDDGSLAARPRLAAVRARVIRQPLYLVVVFLIQSSQSISPQNGI